MKLSELFNHLTYGELANLKIGGKDEGGIHPTYSKEVLTYIQQGLTDLHTRFNLKQGECIIQLNEAVSMYTLSSAHAYSNTESTEYFKYIDDLGMYPFLDDIIRVNSVYDECGHELELNTDCPSCTVYTPQYNVLQVTNPESTNAIGVIYKADHKPIILGAKTNPATIEIEIPSTMINLLCLYVAYAAHNSVGTQEGIATGFTKYQQYEAACLNVEHRGIINSNYYINNRIRRNGWV